MTNIPTIDVKQLRDKLGISQAELAKKLGTTVTTVSRWENGKSKPQGFFRIAMGRMK